MELTRYADIQAFYQRAEPFLVAHEAEHNLVLGICAGLLRGDVYAAPPYLAVVADGDTVAAVAIRTPPYNLLLSLDPERALVVEALALLARDLAANQPGLPGVHGPEAVGAAFAVEWQALTGRPYEVSMRQRVYQLTAVRPATGVPGQLRRAQESDRALLVRWLAAFHDEALSGHEPLDTEEWVERALGGSRTLCLWEDGQPVSLACAGNATPHGIRIGPVYTPPEHRGRGYASACTAALSQQQLDAGRRFCFLFTDLANPTSNHIYQTIGYTPVGDVAIYRFGGAAPA